MMKNVNKYCLYLAFSLLFYFLLLLLFVWYFVPPTADSPSQGFLTGGQTAADPRKILPSCERLCSIEH